MSEKRGSSAFRSGLRLLLVSLVAVFVIGGCKKDSEPTTPQPASLDGWVKQASGTVNYLYNIHFIDANTGTVVGDDGTILRTTDGGATWTPQVGGPYANFPSTFTGVAFTDMNHGTITGFGTTRMLRTTNGGTDWFIAKLTGLGFYTELYAVTFSNTNTGFAVGGLGQWENGAILRTTNGGADWSRYNPDEFPWMSFYSVSFPTADIGYAVGREGTIIRTDNGGTTWTRQNSGVTVYLNDVSFTDANTGIAVGSEYIPDEDSTRSIDTVRSVILGTTDGGMVWKKLLTIEDVSFFAVCLTDANNGTVVGSKGTILRTTNGGTIWVKQNSGTTETLHDVFFTDRNTGTAVGQNGVILRTTSGGF